MNEKYPETASFLGAYFHQDFMIEYESPDAAISAYALDVPHEYISVVCSEIDELVPIFDRMGDSETFFCRTFGCYYSPSADGLSVSDWLKHVREKLRSVVQKV